MDSSFLEFKQVVIANALRRCELFQEPMNVDLHALAAVTVTKTLSKGEYLFREGAVAHGFYVVQRGAISLHRVGSAGREQVIHIVRPFETFAEESIFCDSGFQSDAKAIEPTQVLLVPKAEFFAAMKKHPELSLRMLKVMNRQLNTLLDTLENLRLKDVKTRVAGWLLEHCPDPDSASPCEIELTITKRLLASELGIASETFSRILRKLQRERHIAVNGRFLTLLCPSRLAGTMDKKVQPLPAMSSAWHAVNRGTRVTDLFPGQNKAAAAR